MDHGPGLDDLDPTGAATLEELALLLRRLHTRAGKRTYRELEKWAEAQRLVLARATISEVLRAKRLPSKQFMVTFVRACGVAPGETAQAWIAAWEKVAESHLVLNPPREFGGVPASRHRELQERHDELRQRCEAVEAAGVEAAAGCHELGAQLDHQGRLKEGAAAYGLAAGIRRRILGDNHPTTLDTRHHLAWARGRLGDWAGARTELQRVLAARRATLGDEHPATLNTRQNLAWVHGPLGDWAGVQTELREVLDVQWRTLGDDHPATLSTRQDLAWVQGRLGDWSAAFNEFRQVYESRQRILGDEHPATLDTRHKLAWAQGRRGDLASAQVALQEVLDAQRRILGDDHPDTLATLQDLAWIQKQLGDWSGAQVAYEEVLDAQRRILGDNHPDTVSTRHNMLQLGVDYGSSTTTAILRWPDGRIKQLLFSGSPLLPSAVYLDEDGDLVVGHDAVRAALADPARFEPAPLRRIDDGTVLLGDDEISVDALIAATLRYVAAEAARVAGVPVGSVTLSCPAHWGTLRQGVLAQAATEAGLRDPTLVAAPVAAANYYAAVLGRGLPDGGHMIVYSLGASAFEVALVRRAGSGFAIVAAGGLPDFGGVDIDAVVVDLVGRQMTDREEWRRLTAPGTPAEHNRSRAMWEAARAAKEMLSRTSSADVEIPAVAQDFFLSREELEQAATAPLKQTVDITTGLITGAGLSAPDILGLLLVGGGSRMPLVASLLHRGTGVIPMVLEQPEVVIARGSLEVGGY